MVLWHGRQKTLGVHSQTAHQPHSQYETPEASYMISTCLGHPMRGSTYVLFQSIMFTTKCDYRAIGYQSGFCKSAQPQRSCQCPTCQSALYLIPACKNRKMLPNCDNLYPTQRNTSIVCVQSNRQTAYDRMTASVVIVTMILILHAGSFFDSDSDSRSGSASGFALRFVSTVPSYLLLFLFFTASTPISRVVLRNVSDNPGP